MRNHIEPKTHLYGSFVIALKEVRISSHFDIIRKISKPRRYNRWKCLKQNDALCDSWTRWRQIWKTSRERVLKPSRAWKCVLCRLFRSAFLRRTRTWKICANSKRTRSIHPSSPRLQETIMFGAAFTWSTVKKGIRCSATFQFLKGVTGRWNTLTSVIALYRASPTISWDTRGAWRNFCSTQIIYASCRR